MRAALMQWTHQVRKLATPRFDAPELPAPYRILPHTLPFDIPGFSRDNHPSNRVLALQPEPPCALWYGRFIDRLVQARGRQHLPVYRMGDGEFRFVLGVQPPDLRRPTWARWGVAGVDLGMRLWHRGNFAALTVGRYHSGAYSRREWRALTERVASDVHRISTQGILALHLSYGRTPWQEQYFPALATWLAAHGMQLTLDNYVPFYFVYAALTGPRAAELLGGRVLVVNCAVGSKRERIIDGLHRAGAAQVLWCGISERRALYDRIDVRPYAQRVDVALVGAGIGKSNILAQMRPLQVPCIDAGFVFEVWADPSSAAERPYCSPDAAGA